MNVTTRFCLAALLISGACGPYASPAPSHPAASDSLTVALGTAASATGSEQAGVRQVVRNIATEPLLNYGRDGRPVPVLAEEWVRSDDGRSVRLRLRRALFHDGSPVTSDLVRESLLKGLPRFLGPAYEDVHDVQALSEREVEIRLTRPSPFPLEALDVQIEKPGPPPIGTGPYRQLDVSSEGVVQMVANSTYYLGKPAIERVWLKPYQSLRAAWADLLRGDVDMLYEVGADALDSLEPSSRVRVFSYRRHYVYLALFNMNSSVLRNAIVRRRLNAAVNRGLLIADGLGGHGVPARDPIWPDHWANANPDQGPSYAPETIADPSHRLRLNCVIADPAHERLAIALQRQLQSVGVDLNLELVGPDEALKRVGDRDFDVLLTEAISGPSLLRPYLFWHSKGPYNYGGFASASVDAALDSIRHAASDDAYRLGVAAFQRAIVDDPPAIFLAWSERARAVSTVFDVQSEPGRDVLTTLRLWRPAGAGPIARVN